MKICKECGNIIHEPRYRLFVKIEKVGIGTDQTSASCATLEEISSVLVTQLMEQAADLARK